MKNCNDTIGNRTRDLPACSAVPQPTAPPRAPKTSPQFSEIKKVDVQTEAYNSISYTTSKVEVTCLSLNKQ